MLFMRSIVFEAKTYYHRESKFELNFFFKKWSNQSFSHTYMKNIKNNKCDKIIYKIKNRCFIFIKY
jgi:hypothetical protein